MGKYDSSKTRVVPIFDQLYKTDRTGHSWLAKLLSLPVGGKPTSIPLAADLTIQKCGWGNLEEKLEPPVALLSWLIRHPRKPVSGQLSADPVKAKNRSEWIEGSEARILEGLTLLRNNPKNEDWHLFEGQTQPDVFIQTPSTIVVIEGKRTERGPTTSTKWMAGRHQIIRHIDCAWEIAAGRKIVGFFVVEGDCTGEVPAEWLDHAKQTIGHDAVRTSLPHRGPEEQSGIIACFAGVTTWQRLCKEFDLEWVLT